VSNREPVKLLPLRVRLLVFAVLVVIALGCIRLIDSHVMARMRSLERDAEPLSDLLADLPDAPTTSLIPPCAETA